MTTNEFLTVILKLLPDAVLGEDQDGQLIIHTGLQESKEGNVEGLKLDLEKEPRLPYGLLSNLHDAATCILYGEPGEDPEDCNTHGHEFLTAKGGE